MISTHLHALGNDIDAYIINIRLFYIYSVCVYIYIYIYYIIMYLYIFFLVENDSALWKMF